MTDRKVRYLTDTELLAYFVDLACQISAGGWTIEYLDCRDEILRRMASR